MTGNPLVTLSLLIHHNCFFATRFNFISGHSRGRLIAYSTSGGSCLITLSRASQKQSGDLSVSRYGIIPILHINLKFRGWLGRFITSAQAEILIHMGLKAARGPPALRDPATKFSIILSPGKWLRTLSFDLMRLFVWNCLPIGDLDIVQKYNHQGDCQRFILPTNSALCRLAPFHPMALLLGDIKFKIQIRFCAIVANVAFVGP